jgi:hypothetical protein
MAGLLALGGVACSSTESTGGSTQAASKTAACRQLGVDLKSTGTDVTAVGKTLSADRQPNVKPLQNDDDTLHGLVTTNPGDFATNVGPLADALGRLIVDLQQTPGKIASDVTQLTPALHTAAAYCKIPIGS